MLNGIRTNSSFVLLDPVVRVERPASVKPNESAQAPEISVFPSTAPMQIVEEVYTAAGKIETPLPRHIASA